MTAPGGPPRRTGREVYPRVSDKRPLDVVDLRDTIRLLEAALALANKWHGQVTTMDPVESRVTRARLGERNSDLMYIGQLARAASAEVDLEHMRLRDRPDPRRSE